MLCDTPLASALWAIAPKESRLRGDRTFDAGKFPR
ncbi:MAG: YceI family protein [Brasilonema angustatum HA4187-MV1]|nr:YceI family protein [Brasilonema angustatum HA4187-MV1]